MQFAAAAAADRSADEAEQGCVPGTIRMAGSGGYEAPVEG